MKRRWRHRTPVIMYFDVDPVDKAAVGAMSR